MAHSHSKHDCVRTRPLDPGFNNGSHPIRIRIGCGNGLAQYSLLPQAAQTETEDQ
jgi:hypothetical protein